MGKLSVMHYSYCVCFWIILFIQLCFSQDDLKDLKLLNIIFRHGDRTLISYYPNDPNINKTWPEGFGELTILGKKQQYALGTYLRKRYANFITTNPREIYARSSSKDRALSSAQCHLAALYSPDTKWQWNPNLKWQPIPIYSVRLAEDDLLFTDSICPEATREEKRILKSKPAQNFLKEYKELFSYLTNHSGTTISNWTNACYLHDTLKIEKLNKLPIPEWVGPVWENLSYVADMNFFWSFSTRQIQKFRAGPLIKKILGKMNDWIMKKSDAFKVFLYSTHDTEVAAVLNALNVFNNKSPPYCATILIEFHEKNIEGQGPSYLVRVLYLNSTKPEEAIEEPHLVLLPGCDAFCPFETFSDIVEGIIPKNWHSECGIGVHWMSISAIAAITILSILIVVVGVSFVYTFMKYNELSKRHIMYLRLPTE